MKFFFPGLLILVIAIGASMLFVNQSSAPSSHTSYTTPVRSDRPTYLHAQPDEEHLIAQVQKGGYILLMRHERTQLDKTFDDLTKGYEVCAAQRVLSNAGKESARDIGEATKRINVPIAKIYSSPFCRSLETAQLAFGKPEIVEMLSGRKNRSEKQSSEQGGAYLKSFLDSIEVPAASNIAVVAHWITINGAFNIHTHEGDIAVFKKDGTSYSYLGNIHPPSWSDYIHDTDRLIAASSTYQR